MLRFTVGHLYLPTLLAVVGMVLRPAQRRQFLTALIALTTAALLANALQGAIGRYRPNQADSHLAFAPPLSQVFAKEKVCFPSGEAATAFAFAAMAARFLPTGRPVARWRMALFSIAALTALARLVNGAHYVSDVAAGALFGTAVATAAWALLDTRRRPARS